MESKPLAYVPLAIVFLAGWWLLSSAPPVTLPGQGKSATARRRANAKLHQNASGDIAQRFWFYTKEGCTVQIANLSMQINNLDTMPQVRNIPVIRSILVAKRAELEATLGNLNPATREQLEQFHPRYQIEDVD